MASPLCLALDDAVSAAAAKPKFGHRVFVSLSADVDDSKTSIVS